jgi:S-adenosylmethionine:tRNA ribosyltransferase-isomerase
MPVQTVPPPTSNPLDFELPPHLEATEPPEARGLARDDVRLMVSYRADDRVIHTDFREIAAFLDPDDLLVVNTSGTLNASLPARLPDGREAELHLSTHLPGDIWTVELRSRQGSSTSAIRSLHAPLTLSLPAGATAVIHGHYHCGCFRRGEQGQTHLWIATLHLSEPLLPYLERHGSPIRYDYVRGAWPGPYYQTVFASEPGSAEMPSAGRAFTPRVVQDLGRRGVRIAPLVLHTGVASVEDHEPPYEEFYRVPLETARAVNRARHEGRRVVAVGTTVVRALETVVNERGVAHQGEGWTCTVITPERGVRAIDGLLTGFHEPRASHLLMLEAIAGRPHLELAYHEALEHQYLWHEFGDMHLIL